MIELEEFKAVAARAPAECDVLLEALRTATAAVSRFSGFCTELQAEAQDAEFEDIPGQLRAHLEGRLLQRARFMKDRDTELLNRLRDLSAGARELRKDCADVPAVLEAAAKAAVAPEAQTT